MESGGSIQCAFADASEEYTKKKDSTYKNHLDIVERLRDPISEAFGLSKLKRDTMSYYDLIKYSDTVFARNFEGLDVYHKFTDKNI